MLIPISHQEAVDRRARFGVDLPVHADDGPFFRCRHWDETTRLCGIYDTRPAMCRDYPYGQPCEHGCSCQARRLPILWEGDQA